MRAQRPRPDSRVLSTFLSDRRLVLFQKWADPRYVTTGTRPACGRTVKSLSRRDSSEMLRISNRPRNHLPARCHKKRESHCIVSDGEQTDGGVAPARCRTWKPSHCNHHPPPKTTTTFKPSRHSPFVATTCYNTNQTSCPWRLVQDEIGPHCWDLIGAGVWYPVDLDPPIVLDCVRSTAPLGWLWDCSSWLVQISYSVYK